MRDQTNSTPASPDLQSLLEMLSGDREPGDDATGLLDWMRVWETAPWGR